MQVGSLIQGTRIMRAFHRKPYRSNLVWLVSFYTQRLLKGGDANWVSVMTLKTRHIAKSNMATLRDC